MSQKIVFFVQTKKPIGGSQVLFLDLASYLADNFSDEYDVYYINHSNPMVNKLYGSSNIHLLDVEKCDYSQFEGAIFFTPVNYILYLLAKIKNVKTAKLCLYFYHPQIMDWLSMQIWRGKVNFDPFLNLLQNTNSYCFMDSSNFVALKNVSKVDFQERYVPVAIHDVVETEDTNLQYVDNDKINIGWLGRLDRDKIYSLINLADNLLALESPKQIDFHIVGDGNSKQLIRVSNYSPNIRFIFTSYLYGDERNEYIKNNVDIMVAMGMSATDVAQLSVPTVIPIVSPTAFKDDKYMYIFNIHGYSLGWNREDIKYSGCKLNTIEDILQDIYEYGKKDELGHKCSDFVNDMFSIKNCADNMLNIANMSQLTVETCMRCKLIKRQLSFYSLYCLFRKKSDFARFHEFNARIKRINQQPTFMKKIKRLLLEVRVTLRRNHK